MWCFFFQAEDGIRDLTVTGVQTCALPISARQDVSCKAQDPCAECCVPPAPRDQPLAGLRGKCHRYEVYEQIGRASCRERMYVGQVAVVRADMPGGRGHGGLSRIGAAERGT